MKSLELLHEAEILPRGVLGQGRIVNREELLVKLAHHRRTLSRAFAVLYVLAIVVAVAMAAVLLRAPSPTAQSFAPILGSSSFIGLLLFARYLTKDWMVCTLPLMIADHASDDQLADLITNLLSSFTKLPVPPRAPPKPAPTSQPSASHSAAPMARSKVVIVASPQDRQHLELLRRHLRPIAERHGIDVWDETQIGVGARWREEISGAITEATLAVLVVSVDLLGSEVAYSLQLSPLLQTAKEEGATIIPIIAGPCMFAASPLAEFQPANPPERPLSIMKKPEREALLNKVVARIIELTRGATSPPQN